MFNRCGEVYLDNVLKLMLICLENFIANSMIKQCKLVNPSLDRCYKTTNRDVLPLYSSHKSKVKCKHLCYVVP